MKSFFAFSLLVLLINASTLFAKKYNDIGLDGSLGFLYRDENYDQDDKITQQKEFTQQYSMRYRGNIYNPNLIDYSLSGLLHYDDIEQKVSGENRKTKVTDTDYGISANIIKKSKFPFKVYYKNKSRPQSVVYSNYSSSLISDIENYGILGSVKLDNFNIKYEATKDTNINDNLEMFSDKTISKYGTRFQYKTKNNSITLTQMHTDNNDNYINYGKKSSLEFSDDNFGLSYNGKLNKSLTISSSLGHLSSTHNDAAITNANFNVNFKPKEKYSTHIGVAASRSDFYIASDLNNSSNKELNRMDTIDLNQNFRYKLIKNLSFSQSVNYFKYDGSNLSGANSNFKLKTDYRYDKKLNSQRQVSFSSSLGSNIQKNKSTDAKNITTSSNINRYVLNSKANINEQMPSIKSSLKASVNYDAIRSSSAEYENNYGANISFVSKINIFTNILESSYYAIADTTTIRYSDNINVTKNVGIKGRITASAGIEQMERTGGILKIKSELYKAKVNFRYRLLRKILFTSNAKISQDLGYNTLKYSSRSELSFKKALTKISISYDYDYSDINLNNNTTNIARSILQAKFNRRF